MDDDSGLELNIVHRPSATPTSGEKPTRFVKRHRFKAKREQKGHAKVGLGQLRIKEAPLVGPEPTAATKPQGPKVEKPASSAPLGSGSKKRPLAAVAADVGQHRQDQKKRATVPAVQPAKPVAPKAAAKEATTSASEATPHKAPPPVFTKLTTKPKPAPHPATNASPTPSSPAGSPSRKHPVPTSVARLDEYHAKPSQLDHALVKAAAPILSSASKGKSSKHIFTATPFSALGLHDHLVSVLGSPKEHHGFNLKVATRVQSAALPALLDPHRPNALLCSETGSGKTLAYLLPLLQHLQAKQPRPTRAEGTRAIIVAPTRELCHQIHDVLSKLVRAFIWVVPGLVSGGEKRKSEKARLRKGIMVLVGTPGRLLDHLQNSQAFGHEMAEWLVLDEVDRLLDLGFEAQVREIVGRLRGQEGGGRPRLQVLAASATLNPALDKFGRELLGDHVRIDAKTGTVKEAREGGGKNKGEEAEDDDEDDESDGDDDAEAAPPPKKSNADLAHAASDNASFTTPVQLVQQYMVVTCKLRLPALTCFLRVHASTHKTVVFFSTCDSVDFHHALFQAAQWPGGSSSSKEHAGDNEEDDANDKFKLLLGPGMPVYRLHGNIAQAERLQTFRTFREATRGVLFCTDVAARGLDLPAVDWIVQYDPPTEAAEYVHRVGRTARRGRKGHALLFLLPSEQGYLDVLRKRGIHPTALSLQQTLFQATPARFRGRFRAPEEVFCLEIQQKLEKAVERHDPMKEEEKGGDGAKAASAAAATSLLTMGRKAFGSFVRAYATHPAELKTIFAVRALHLGHVAKSFALKEPPTSLKVGKDVIQITPGSKNKMKEKKDKDEAFSAPRQQPKKGKPRSLTAFSAVSEFSSGM